MQFKDVSICAILVFVIGISQVKFVNLTLTIDIHIFS